MLFNPVNINDFSFYGDYVSAFTLFIHIIAWNEHLRNSNDILHSIFKSFFDRLPASQCSNVQLRRVVLDIP